MITRRSLLAGLAGAGIAGAARAQGLPFGLDGDAGSGFVLDRVGPGLGRAHSYAGWYVDEIPDGDFSIGIVDPNLIAPQYRRQDVAYAGPEALGSLVVDTARRFLFLVAGGGRATRYGVGVGREGFAWSGDAVVGRKARWPSWRPPPEMLRRQPELPTHMAGGPENPLGARALYLYQDGRDTLYRIHGTNEPDSIGLALSSGCIRLLNEDVLDLYRRVPVGARVRVLPASA